MRMGKSIVNKFTVETLSIQLLMLHLYIVILLNLYILENIS
jgi:hypothetical protein